MAIGKVKEIIHYLSKHSKIGGVTVLLVHVDDIIVMREYEQEREDLKNKLTTEFRIKELED